MFIVKSYFEYILEKCSDQVIPSVCSIYKTKAELLGAALKRFNNDYILGQDLLIDAATDFTAQGGYINENEFCSDGKKIYLRCINSLMQMNQENLQHIDIDRERIFNTLINLNWLFSSKYTHIQRKQNGAISLLESPIIIRIKLRKALKEVLFDSAYYAKDRSEQYSTATLLRYQIFSGMHPDPEVRNYYAQGCTVSDFERLKEQAKECSIRRMALFYALTATAARAEEIRRMW